MCFGGKMFLKSVQLLSLLFVLQFALACSKSDGKPSVDENPNGVANYDTKSCTYSLNEGVNADFSNLNKKDIRSAFFNKEFTEAEQQYKSNQ